MTAHLILAVFAAALVANWLAIGAWLVALRVALKLRRRAVVRQFAAQVEQHLRDKS